MMVPVVFVHVVCHLSGRILSGFTDEEIKKKANYDRLYAASRGISGTPSYLWNGLPGKAEQNAVWSNLVQKLQNFTHS